MSTSTSALAKHVEAPLVLTTKTPRTLGFFDQFTLWGNLGISLFGPVTGALIAAYTGSLASGLVAVVVGCVIGGLVLGRQGSLAPTVLNIAQNIGWATMEIIVISQAAVAVTSERWRWLFVLLAGAIATTMAVRPLGSVRLLRKVMVWLVLLASAYLFVEVLRHSTHPLPQDGVLGFWPGVDLAAAGVVSVATLQTNDADVITALVTLPAGAIALFVLLVDEVDEAYANIYSTTMSAHNVIGHVDRRWISVAIGVLATVLALFVDLGNYTQFLYLIGSVFVPLFAVAIADFFVVSRMRWDVSSTARFRWQPAVAWLCGFVAYQLVWPGTVKGWSDIWVDVQGWLHFTPPAWLGATYTSIIVGAVAAVLLGMTSQKAAQR